VTTLILAVVFLGEEIGWRGFLPLRLCELMFGRRAAVLTGACDAIFHVPLLILTTTYQYAGSRWIVAPTVTAIHRRSHRCRNRLAALDATRSWIDEGALEGRCLRHVAQSRHRRFLERLPTPGPQVVRWKLAPRVRRAPRSGRMPPSVRAPAAAQFLQYLESV
jgi:hypothetical protein